MKFVHVFSFGILLLLTQSIHAQVGININNSTPHASAMLDISSTDKGMLVPRMTTTQRDMINSPALGLLVFDTETETFWFYDSMGWTELKGGDSISKISDADDDTMIQVEESSDEDVIRLDIKGNEHFEMRPERFTMKAVELSSNDIRLLFDGQSSNNGSDAINEIRNILPVFPANDGSSKMQFYIRENRVLEVCGDGIVRINDAYNLPSSDGNIGQVIKTNGSGNLSWGSISKVEDSDGDTQIQVEESANEDIIRADIEGVEILRMVKNANGYTLFETPNSGGNSTLFGENTGGSLTTGTSNAFFGKSAGNTITTGNSNTLIGTSAGGNNNGSNNVFLGRAAGTFNTSGGNNTFLGTRAGVGTSNGAISGSGNVFIGHEAGSNESGSNKLFIENTSSTSPLIYGEFNNNLVRINGTFETTSNTSIGGTLKIGSSSAISGIYKTSVSKNVGNIGGNSSRIETFTVSGASLGDVVFVSPSENLQSQVVIAQAWVSGSNTVSVRFRNTDGGSQDPDGGNGATYYISVIK